MRGTMNYKRYRLCLAGLIVAALVLGIFFYMKTIRESDMPSDSILVENSRIVGDEMETWA